MAISNLIASRFSELDFYRVYQRYVSVSDVLEMHLNSRHHIMIDLCTDAMNLFELLVHKKALPNDKHHRVGILALREDRLTRRIRNVYHLPTSIMLADPLTKHMISKVFMLFVTTGTWSTITDKQIRIKLSCKRPSSYTENDLITNDFPEATKDDIGVQIQTETDSSVESSVQAALDKASEYPSINGQAFSIIKRYTL